MPQGSSQKPEFFVNPEFITSKTRLNVDSGRENSPFPRFTAKGGWGHGHTVLNPKTQIETRDAPNRDGPAPHGSDRFERRRADIVTAAIPVLNGQGFKGMRLTAVAELIGLRATGVTYYFPRKEELAVACLESGFAVLNDLVAEAEREADAEARITKLIALFVARDADVRQGKAVPLASFSAIRALDGEHRDRVAEGYTRMFRRVRNLFASPELEAMDQTERTIRSLILLEQLFWAMSWLGDFDIEEYPRLAARMADIALNGLAPSALNAPLPVLAASNVAAERDESKESFLKAAALQINAHGYRGASVDRISASLNLTKGAFYHHNEAKDDLVAACFRRSFGIMRDTQVKARALAESEARRLAAAVEALISFQLGPEGPLLRTSVLSSMPSEHKAEIIGHSYRISRQFASMVVDSITDGSGRSVDPMVAGAMVHAAINIASDARPLKMAQEPDIVARFVRAVFAGFLAV
jgi:AcrR family transcriptional regulator